MSSTWTKALVGGAMALALTVVGLEWRIESRWKEAQAAVEQLRTTDRAQPLRPVLRGTAQEGQAWSHYVDAARLLAGAGIDGDWERLRSGGEAVRAAAVAKAAPALAELASGARCTNGACTQHHPDQPDIDALRALDLGRAAVTAAAHALPAQANDAVAPLLDAMQLGRDLAHGRSLVENLVGLLVLREALDLALASDLPARLETDLAVRLGDSLTALDHGIERACAALREELVFVVDTVRLPTIAPNGVVSAGWRYAFSERLAIAALVRSEVARIAAWDAAVASTEPVTRTRRLTDPPLPVTVATRVLVEATEKRLGAIAALRALRLLVDDRLGVASPRLRDPLGAGELHLRTDPDGRRTVVAIPAGPDSISIAVGRAH